MTLEDNIHRLSRTPPFDLLPRDALQLIAFAAEKRNLAADERLFEEGEPADSGFVVFSGAILLSAGGEGRERRRVAGPGALIGEKAMIAEVVRPSSARAMENSTGTAHPTPDLSSRACRVSEGRRAYKSESRREDAENVATA